MIYEYQYFKEKPIKFAYFEIRHTRKSNGIPINPAIFRRVICNRCYYERLSFDDNHPLAKTFLSPLFASVFFLSSFYIGAGYCYSKCSRYELPKYLRAPIARERNPYWWANPRQFLLDVFRHSWEEIKVSACKRLQRISRHACEIYVLIDLNRCFHTCM